MPQPSNEAKVILALEALQNDKNLSLRAVAKLYNVPTSTLGDRRASRPIRRDIPANLYSLTDLEEQTIIQYIIELSIRAFPPKLRSIEDIANHLQRKRDIPPIGKR